jgi:hypothetical protein
MEFASPSRQEMEATAKNGDILMRLFSKMAGVMTMAALSLSTALVTPAAAQQSASAQALGMLPKEAGVAMALDLSAFANQQSLLSYVPRAEVEQMVAKELQEPGNPAPTSSLEAAMKIAFMPGMSGKVSAIAMGFAPDTTTASAPAVPADPSQGTEYLVLLGSFTKAELGPQLKPLGIKPGPTPETALLPSASGKDYFISLPADGTVLISQKQDWIANAKTISESRSGLTASGSSFINTYQSVGGAMPDVLLYVDGGMLKQAAQSDPGAAMMMAPLLTVKGLMLSLQPGDQPQVQLTAAYADAQQAQFGAEFFRQGIQMMKGFAQQAMAGQVQQDPAMKAQMDETMKLIDSLQVSSSDSAAKVQYKITELPDREEAKKAILEGMEGVMSGNMMPMQPGMMGGPSMSGGPTN